MDHQGEDATDTPPRAGAAPPLRRRWHYMAWQPAWYGLVAIAAAHVTVFLAADVMLEEAAARSVQGGVQVSMCLLFLALVTVVLVQGRLRFLVGRQLLTLVLMIAFVVSAGCEGLVQLLPATTLRTTDHTSLGLIGFLSTNSRKVELFAFGGARLPELASVVA